MLEGELLEPLLTGFGKSFDEHRAHEPNLVAERAHHDRCPFRRRVPALDGTPCTSRSASARSRIVW